jgi:hypothetical protein
MATDAPIQPGALEYSRSVFEHLMDWYKVADAKGRLLLTLNGIYITVLSSVALASPHNLINHKATLTPATWALLAGAAAATAISILSAIGCLYSRLSNANLDKHLDRFAEPDPAAASPYRPVATFWFGTIARLDPKIGVPMLQSADEAFELAALTEEVFLLAPNVLAKHRWVNKGWAAAGTSLLLLLAATVTAIAT